MDEKNEAGNGATAVSPQGGASREKNTRMKWRNRALRWLVIACASLVIMTTAWREWQFIHAITGERTYAAPNWTALITDAGIRVGIATAPLLAVLALVLVLVSPRTREDAKRVLWGQDHGKDSFDKAHANAVHRVQALAIVLGGIVACATWMQDVETKRAQASRQLFVDFKGMEGFRILAHDHEMEHRDACKLCDMCTGKAIGASKEEIQKARDVQNAMNFVEAVLHSRNEHTLSETEFQALWEGVVDELLLNLSKHMRSAWGEQIRADSPLLVLALHGR